MPIPLIIYSMSSIFFIFVTLHLLACTWEGDGGVIGLYWYAYMTPRVIHDRTSLNWVGSVLLTIFWYLINPSLLIVLLFSLLFIRR